MLALWWGWIGAALLLGILEIFLPGAIFLGFAVGAAVTGLLLLVGGPIADWMAGSAPVTVLIFAVASLIGWLAMRRLMGIRSGQSRIVNRDVNED